MAWESRAGTPNQYYTRTSRRGKKRSRDYFGAGPLGEMAALQDLLWRIKKELRRRACAYRLPDHRNVPSELALQKALKAFGLRREE